MDAIKVVDGSEVDSRETSPRLSDDGAAFLTSEQFSLLGTRSSGWNESFSRVSVFLTTLSASAVALALVADASGFDNQFTIFALVLFPIVLFLGIATHVRLVQIALEDVYLVRAMNRLRRAYIDHAPEIGPYLTTGVSDDAPGVWTTYRLERPEPGRHWGQVLITTPTIIATLNAVIATAGAGAVVQYLGGPGVIVGLTCVGTFTTVWAALFSVQLRAFKTARESVPRFPIEDS